MVWQTGAWQQAAPMAKRGQDMAMANIGNMWNISWNLKNWCAYRACWLEDFAWWIFEFRTAFKYYLWSNAGTFIGLHINWNVVLLWIKGPSAGPSAWATLTTKCETVAILGYATAKTGCVSRKNVTIEGIQKSTFTKKRSSNVREGTVPCDVYISVKPSTSKINVWWNLDQTRITANIPLFQRQLCCYTGTSLQPFWSLSPLMMLRKKGMMSKVLLGTTFREPWDYSNFILDRVQWFKNNLLQTWWGVKQPGWTEGGWTGPSLRT